MTVPFAAVAPSSALVRLVLPEVRVTKLANYNQAKQANYHARHALHLFWETLTRGQLDQTFVIDRARILVRFWKPDAHRADVGNYHPTAKAIVDGLVRKRDRHGRMQDGYLPDDDDKRVVGPDLRRGLDPSLKVGRLHYVRVTVDILPIGPEVEAWWLPAGCEDHRLAKLRSR